MKQDRNNNYLLGKIDFKNDVSSYKKSYNLLVEGQTDRRFLRDILNKDVSCTVVSEYGTFVGTNFDHKKQIINIVCGLPNCKKIQPNKAEENSEELYGMIDLDYDSVTQFMSYPKMFVTDTHDVETLIMSTDAGVFKRLEKCEFHTDEIKKAFFVAYPIGIVYSVVHKTKDLKSINKEKIDYSEFVTNNEINISRMADHIIRKKVKKGTDEKLKKLSPDRIKEEVDRISKNKVIKKHSNKGIMMIDLKDFNPNDINDYWKVVNGHVILSLLKYINKNAGEMYSDRTIQGLDRTFEFAIIKHYDISCFKNTEIYAKMHSQNLVKERLTSF